MARKTNGTGPKNLAKKMTPGAGRIKGGHSLKPKQPRKLNINSLRNKTNPTRAK